MPIYSFSLSFFPYRNPEGKSSRRTAGRGGSPKWFSPEVHLLANGGGLLHAQFVARGEQEGTLGEEIVLADFRVAVALVLPVGGAATALLIQAQHRATL